MGANGGDYCTLPGVSGWLRRFLWSNLEIEEPMVLMSDSRVQRLSGFL